MRDDGRWHLTDPQRLLIALMVGVAIFLGAVSWGMGGIEMLLVALGILVVAGLLVFLLGLRYNSRPTGPGLAYVVTAAPPPVGKIVGRCELVVLLDMPGAPAGQVRLRDRSVPTSKWPRTGDELPVDLEPHTRRPRIRWDRVDPIQSRVAKPPAPTPSRSPGANRSGATGPSGPAPRPMLALPMHATIEEVTAAPAPPAHASLDDDSPTPPVARIDEDSPTPPVARIDEDSPTPAVHRVEEDHPTPPVARVEEDSPTPSGSVPPRAWTRPDATPVIEEAAILGEISGPAPQPRAARPEESPALPTRPIPQPRASDRPADDGGPPAMGVTLIVKNLERSLAFYRDLIGLQVVDRTEGTAVLAYGSGRVLMRQVTDMSPPDRRLIYLHIEVSDVEESYRRLHARGVHFGHKPRVTNRGHRLELWSAVFRDPDEHSVAITQWQAREEAPRNP